MRKCCDEAQFSRPGATLFDLHRRLLGPPVNGVTANSASGRAGPLLAEPRSLTGASEDVCGTASRRSGDEMTRRGAPRRLNKLLVRLGCVCCLGLSFAFAQTPGQAPAPSNTVGQEVAVRLDDVIATVGGRAIRFNDLTKELDRGAAVGVSVPGYGTPERKRILMRLLDDAIRNELLYLDALKKGVEENPAYQRAFDRFKDNVLAGLFRERQVHGGQQVPTEDLRAQWRAGIPITINPDALDPALDAARSDDEVLATVGDAAITWGDAKARLLVATRRAALSEGRTDAAAERRKVLDQLIDVPVMAFRAREAGLEQDPAYLQRVAAFEKTGLANFHYRQLAAAMSPTKAEMVAYAQEKGEGFDALDDKARRAIKYALVERKMGEYIEDLEKNGFHVTVNEAKLDRLFANEAAKDPPPGRAGN